MYNYGGRWFCPTPTVWYSCYKAWLSVTWSAGKHYCQWQKAEWGLLVIRLLQCRLTRVYMQLEHTLCILCCHMTSCNSRPYEHDRVGLCVSQNSPDIHMMLWQNKFLSRADTGRGWGGRWGGGQKTRLNIVMHEAILTQYFWWLCFFLQHQSKSLGRCLPSCRLGTLCVCVRARALNQLKVDFACMWKLYCL